MRDLVKRQVDFSKDNPRFYMEIYGLSSETKPTEQVASGSYFVELDTSIVHLFSETGEVWYPTLNLGGGA